MAASGSGRIFPNGQSPLGGHIGIPGLKVHVCVSALGSYKNRLTMVIAPENMISEIPHRFLDSAIVGPRPLADYISCKHVHAFQHISFHPERMNGVRIIYNINFINPILIHINQCKTVQCCAGPDSQFLFPKDFSVLIKCNAMQCVRRNNKHAVMHIDIVAGGIKSDKSLSAVS